MPLSHSSRKLHISVDGWAVILALFAALLIRVGLRTNLRELGKQGARPFLVGAIGEIVIAALTLGLIYGATRIVNL